MTYLTAIILGIVEGATEFIPVSSSGHLIVVRQILNINDSTGLAFDAILQLATTLALVVYFWKDLWQLFLTFVDLVSGKNLKEENKAFLYAVILGTIPAVIFGLLLEKQMETVFRNVSLVALSLVIGSLLIFTSEWFSNKYVKQNKNLGIGRGVLIGLFQCLALVPGISRSGATISGGLFSGLSKDDAVRFSFILSIPILTGSGLKKLFDVRHDLFVSGHGLTLLLGSVTAFAVGLFSINFLIKYLKNHSLNVFVVYRLVLAAFLFLFLR
jgi:undecaprenyl-diphosphatase